MDLKNCDAYFFDFDGVLVDSVEVKTRAFAKLFEHFGPSIEDAVVDHHRKNGGMTRTDKFKCYYREFLDLPLDETELSQLCARFAAIVVDEVVAAPEIPSSSLFVRRCCQDAPCFIVSATPETEIRDIVSRRSWSKYFRDVLGAPVSKKDHLAKLLRDHGFAPTRCCFFGDAESDYQAAKACGVPFIGVLPGPCAPLLKAAPEIAWIRDFSEILCIMT